MILFKLGAELWTAKSKIKILQKEKAGLIEDGLILKMAVVENSELLGDWPADDVLKEKARARIEKNSELVQERGQARLLSFIRQLFDGGN